MSNFELEEAFREWWAAQGYAAKPNPHTVNIATAWASTLPPPEPAKPDGPAVPEGREPASVTQQSTNMPDWRGLCEELLSALNGWHQAVFETGISWTRPDENYLIDRARAALAQPEPEVVGPTLADIDEMCERRDFSDYYDDWGPSDQDSRTILQSMMNEAIARWGRPAPAPAEGEVAELVAALRSDAIDCTCSTLTSGDLRRVADLLERLAAPVLRRLTCK